MTDERIALKKEKDIKVIGKQREKVLEPAGVEFTSVEVIPEPLSAQEEYRSFRERTNRVMQNLKLKELKEKNLRYDLDIKSSVPKFVTRQDFSYGTTEEIMKRLDDVGITKPYDIEVSAEKVTEQESYKIALKVRPTGLNSRFSQYISQLQEQQRTFQKIDRAIHFSQQISLKHTHQSGDRTSTPADTRNISLKYSWDGTSPTGLKTSNRLDNSQAQVLRTTLEGRLKEAKLSGIAVEIVDGVHPSYAIKLTGSTITPEFANYLDRQRTNPAAMFQRPLSASQASSSSSSTSTASSSSTSSQSSTTTSTLGIS